MITDLNEILVEWAYRTNDGKPDVKSNAKLLTLEGVLKDFGWSREARAELLSTLMEIAPTTMVSNPNPKGRADKVQYQYAKQWLDDNPDAETSDDFKKDVGQEKDDEDEKPKDKKEKRDLSQISKELYGEDGKGPLLQDSETSQQALDNGYKKGASWVAPGNAGSNFNENMSNEGCLILEKYPDLSEMLEVDLEWLEKHNPNALDLLPSQYKQYSTKMLDDCVPRMDPSILEKIDFT